MKKCQGTTSGRLNCTSGSNLEGQPVAVSNDTSRGAELLDCFGGREWEIE